MLMINGVAHLFEGVCCNKQGEKEMRFFKKAWPFIITGLVVIGIFAFTYLHSNKPVAPIKIYKATVAEPVRTGESKAKPATHQGAQGVETSESQSSVTSESSMVSDMHRTTDGSLDTTDESLATEEVVSGRDERGDVDSDTRNTEEASANPQLSAEELWRQMLLQRKAEIHEQMQAIVPEGGTVHSSENPEAMRQLLQLFRKLNAVEQELSNNPQDPSFEDARTLYKMAMFHVEHVAPDLTPEGNMPISTAEKIVQMWEQDGNFDAANLVRQVIQNAVENGDELIERKHLEQLQ